MTNLDIIRVKRIEAATISSQYKQTIDIILLPAAEIG